MKDIETFVLYAKEIKHDKNTFIVCSAHIGEKWYKVKFNRDCPVEVKEKGIYDLSVNIDDCSLERGKKITNKEGKEVVTNDILWISNVVTLRKYTEEELRERNRTVMGSVFGDDNDGEKLPF